MALNVRRLRFLAVHLLVDAIYLLVSPFVLLYVLVASRCFSRPKFRRGLWQKLGCVPVRESRIASFWIHAVSVGEVLAAAPLIEALRHRYPDWNVDVSVSTYTGFEVARKHLTGVDLFYFPLDPSPVVARVFRRRRPTVVVLIELEVWPNFLVTARRRRVPVLVANGRITERSARRYGYGGGVTASLFQLVSSYGVQNEVYRDRFSALGVGPERLQILGNLKYDRRPSPRVESAHALRQRLGWPSGERLVWVGGSTHPGEERTLWSVYLDLKREFPSLQLVLVPRHVERLSPGELASWSPPDAGAVEMVRWSAINVAVEMDGSSAANGPLGDLPLGEGHVLIVDTVGELEVLYAMADVVFVGGSLIPHGGHNLLEAAWLGKPIAFGPHYTNFQEEAEILLAAGAARCVEDAGRLVETVRGWLQDVGERQRVGEKAREVAEGLGGATQRHMKWIEQQLRLSLPGGDR